MFISTIINEKDAEKFTDMFTIHSDNDTIENELHNNKSAHALNSMTNLDDNNNVEHKFSLQHSKNKSMNKRDKV